MGRELSNYGSEVWEANSESSTSSPSVALGQLRTRAIRMATSQHTAPRTHQTTKGRGFLISSRLRRRDPSRHEGLPEELLLGEHQPDNRSGSVPPHLGPRAGSHEPRNCPPAARRYQDGRRPCAGSQRLRPPRLPTARWARGGCRPSRAIRGRAGHIPSRSRSGPVPLLCRHRMRSRGTAS